MFTERTLAACQQRFCNGDPLRTVSVSMKSDKPTSVTLDTCLFYDKAVKREGNADFDRIIEFVTSGRLRLFFTGTTDFEDTSGAATRLTIKLMSKRLLQEDPNAGMHNEYMPGGPGLHVVDENTCEALLNLIWPDEQWKSASDNKRNDVFHLLAHQKNGRQVFLTRDKKILQKKAALKDKLKITVMAPNELVSLVSLQR